MNYEEFNKLNKGVQNLIEWQYQRSGDFTTSLFETICRADDNNLDRLRREFPEEVKAYENFANVNGWWRDLCKKVDILN